MAALCFYFLCVLCAPRPVVVPCGVFYRVPSDYSPAVCQAVSVPPSFHFRFGDLWFFPLRAEACFLWCFICGRAGSWIGCGWRERGVSGSPSPLLARPTPPFFPSLPSSSFLPLRGSFLPFFMAWACLGVVGGLRGGCGGCWMGVVCVPYLCIPPRWSPPPLAVVWLPRPLVGWAVGGLLPSDHLPLVLPFGSRFGGVGFACGFMGGVPCLS